MSNLLLHQWKLTAKILKKSYAQVATSVVPLVALPKVGALKRIVRRERDYPVSFRFTKNEKEKLHTKAKAAALSVNAYGKAVLLGSD